MWRVLGNANLDESSAAPRQPQRRAKTPAVATSLAQQQTTAAGAAATTNRDSSEKATHSSSSGLAYSNNARGPTIAKAAPEAAAAICGKYRITGTMRKGATGYLYSAVVATRDGEEDSGSGGSSGGGVGNDTGVVLKVEECAAPKRQMQNEWQVRCTAVV